MVSKTQENDFAAPGNGTEATQFGQLCQYSGKTHEKPFCLHARFFFDYMFAAR